MRSYSSVLCHVLNTNPDIDGYGELMIPYRGRRDLLRMRHLAAVTLDRRLTGRYVLDKVLHDHFPIADSVLASRRATVMVSIRTPQDAVASIVTMGRKRGPNNWKADPERAASHYRDRLATCVSAAERRRDVIFFPAEAVVSESDTLLAGLTEALRLDVPLRPTYEVGAHTGRAGFGDTSHRIREGSIRPETTEHDVRLPAALVDELWSDYDSAYAALLSRAGTVLCPASTTTADRTGDAGTDL
ncbi:MAG: hypothetical protein R2754_13235 [Microthrixaceae bacterium]